MRLFKTTIVIWSDYDPKNMEVDALASDAMDGQSYCSQQKTEEIKDVENDPDWDGTEFFGVSEDKDTGETL